jgi:arylsulfatase
MACTTSRSRPNCPRAPVDLKFSFERTEPFGGVGELYVNGKKVDEVEMPQMHISTYSLAEASDVDRDTGTQVSKHYEGTFEFNEELERVIFAVSDENTVPPRKLPAAYY